MPACHLGCQTRSVFKRRALKVVASATLTRDPSKLERLGLHCPRYVAVSADDHRCVMLSHPPPPPPLSPFPPPPHPRVPRCRARVRQHRCDADELLVHVLRRLKHLLDFDTRLCIIFECIVIQILPKLSNPLQQELHLIYMIFIALRAQHVQKASRECLVNCVDQSCVKPLKGAQTTVPEDRVRRPMRLLGEWAGTSCRGSWRSPSWFARTRGSRWLCWRCWRTWRPAPPSCLPPPCRPPTGAPPTASSCALHEAFGRHLLCRVIRA